MKICFVGPADSAHIIKWCRWFCSKGHDIHVISFTMHEIPGVTVHTVNTKVNTAGSDLNKIRYLFTGRQIRRIIEEINPDIVNVHYATSYGATVALSGLKDYILSVWGSDIYDFPRKSVFHKLLLQYSLFKAKVLFSTSQAMADEANKYTKKRFYITPFGVDIDLFNPKKRTRVSEETFIVGTVKSLSEKYGISYILKAVSIVKQTTEIPIFLRIAGDGPDKERYYHEAKELKIEDITSWLGFISQEDAAKEWADMDLAIIPSLQESFGVSAVEAQASGTAVIISDIPGLMEATKPMETSLVVPKKNADAIADAIVSLYKDSEKRKEMADKGREFVESRYELNKCFSYVETLFYEEMNTGNRNEKK